jgi:hypothetical protein
MRSERRHWAAGCCGMDALAEYQRFAQECHRLAQQAATEGQRKALEAMAQAWTRLAKEELERMGVQLSS